MLIPHYTGWVSPEVCSSESIKDDFVDTKKAFVFTGQTLLSPKQDDTFSCSNALKAYLAHPEKTVA